MAQEHGKSGKVLIDQFNLSTFLNSMDINRDVDVPESTTFGNDDRTYIPGLRGGTAALAGFWDSTVTTGIDEVISAALGSTTQKVITLGPGGLANNISYVSDGAYLLSAYHTSYSISAAVDGIVSLTVDIQSSGGLERGRSLHDLAAETGVSEGNSIDAGGATANGGVGHLHVTAAAGTQPTLDVLIEDAADDSTFGTLITFAQATGVTSERVAVTGEVLQYILCSWTIDDDTGGSPSFTFNVSWARR